ncbi:hypothetical protein BDD12DRAFT_940614 [Trichophaea hybrida]|nr:hypothetical protein BDD12DRAFT_940614 [Trichophaea hybrida]
MEYLEDYAESTLNGKWRPRWAERGWTLQEIVMFRQAIFYNDKWSPININVDSSSIKVENRLAGICGVPVNLICCCGGNLMLGQPSFCSLQAKDKPPGLRIVPTPSWGCWEFG